MAFNLDSIQRGCRLRAPRMVLLGVEKIGKSTFAAESGSPIFLPIKREEGIDALDVPQFPTCQTFTDVCTCLETLRNESHSFETVVIDSASALEPLVWEYVCQQQGGVDNIEKVGGGYQKGYIKAVDYWQQIADWLDLLRSERNMASIIIGHVKVKRFDDPAGPSYDQYQFDINDKASALLYRWSDLILFANTKVVVKAEDVGFGKEKHQGIDMSPGRRYLYTQKRPAHPGGGRGVYGQIPYELPLSWDAFVKAVAEVA
jgi:hypothetical protein